VRTLPIEAENLSKWYGDVIGLNDVSFRLDPGVTGLLGPNGAGKSTLVRLCMGLIRPSKGTVRVLGEDPWEADALRRRVGYLPEGRAPWRDKTAREAVAFHARLGGSDPDSARQAADEALADVALEDQATRPVDALSRGMRQRLKFAMALLHDPDLLVLDEPLKGADPVTRQRLMDRIRELPERGRSVLVSTHVLEDLEALTDRMLLLHRGRVLAHGAVGEVRDLLDQVPRRVLVGTPDPDRVGAELWALDSVAGLDRAEAGLVARTHDPGVFYRDLQDATVDADLPVRRIEALDEDLESVFRYLVGGTPTPGGEPA
jgi:ABC-2 type transport system ATP-binding protein